MTKRSRGIAAVDRVSVVIRHGEIRFDGQALRENLTIRRGTGFSPSARFPGQDVRHGLDPCHGRIGTGAIARRILEVVAA